jgi:uncharacterized protein (DUF427 family)
MVNIERIEETSRRVRVLFNKKFIADTKSAKFVWEHPYYPIYYLPSSDVQTKYIEKVSATEDGEGHICRLAVGNRSTEKVIWYEKGQLAGLIRLQFSEMGNPTVFLHLFVNKLINVDAWFEEDTEIYQHPKDPYKRVDIIPSTRHVVVKINDTVIAESSSPIFLYETMLPVRYYLPKTSLNFELIEPSNTVTHCPYKGDANYYSVVIDGKEYKDYIWWYKYPAPESTAIAGRVSFYNEKVDTYIDGVKEENPKSKFS